MDGLNRAGVAALPEPDGLPTPRRHWALAGLWWGMALSVLDAAIANIALPTIARDLGVSPADATWVVTAYQIAIVMTLLPLAALGERLGYRRVYLGGLVLFVLMSLGCAMATDLETLSIARFAQGVGASAMMAVNGALMRFTWPKERLARGIAYNAVVVACTAAAGPALAGLILSLGPWPWLFLINVPMGLAALALVVAFGPHTPSATRLFDWRSALLNAAMFCALFLLVSDVVHGHVSARLIPLALVGGAAGLWLIRRVQSSPRPLIPLDLIRMPRLRLAYGASICGFAAQMCLLVSLPFLLEERLGLSVAVVGMIFLPLPLGIALISPLAGRWAERDWAGLMSAAGLTLFAAMMALMALAIPSTGAAALIAVAMGLCGVGFGLFQAPNNNVMLRAGPIDRAGSAAGMQAQCRLIGQTAGALIAALSLRYGGAGSEQALVIGAVLALCSAAFARAR